MSSTTSQPSPPVPAPKLRADAARNRARVLDAARALFADRGYDVPCEEVARLAGVGIGTIYRHFPTKEALIAAAAEERFAASLAFARSKAATDADPREILVEILTHCAEQQARDRGVSLIAETTFGSNQPSSQVQVEFADIVADLIQRGQARGSIRSDVVPSDVLTLGGALAAVIHNGNGDWRRFLQIVLRGL